MTSRYFPPSKPKVDFAIILTRQVSTTSGQKYFPDCCFRPWDFSLKLFIKKKKIDFGENVKGFHWRTDATSFSIFRKREFIHSCDQTWANSIKLRAILNCFSFNVQSPSGQVGIFCSCLIQVWLNFSRVTVMKLLGVLIAILLAVVSANQSEAWPVAAPEMLNVSSLLSGVCQVWVDNCCD